MKNIDPLLLARFNSRIEGLMGLHFPPTRLNDLERGLCAVAAEFGFDRVEDCLEWLLSTPLSPGQIEILAGHLTVGETYFFRDKRVFEILEGQVLPEIITSRRGKGQNVRIWSAACSSGEEPYSVAILLARMLPDLPQWKISILATDISPASLKKASAGQYREWSFRDTPDWVRQGYFSKVQERFEIAPHIRRMVTFSRLNLATDPYPAIINGTNAIDIILCRNVLMYFSRDRANTVIRNLSRCLVDGGWLFVSAVDVPGLKFPALLHQVRFPGAMLFRKGTKPEDQAPRPLTTPGDSATGKKDASLPPVRQISPVARGSSRNRGPAATRPLASDTREISSDARRLADQGKLSEALAACEDIIRYDKLNPAAHYLQATILLEMARTDEAAASLQRALYIDQDFAVAHFALGHLLQRQGKAREAAKHLQKALALLSRYDPGDVPPEAEGMSAGRLIELITTMPASQAER